MREIEKVGKNYRIIYDIKLYSQLKVYGRRIDNNVIADEINDVLSNGLYYREGSDDDMDYFYEYWIANKGYYIEDLKE